MRGGGCSSSGKEGDEEERLQRLAQLVRWRCLACMAHAAGIGWCQLIQLPSRGGNVPVDASLPRAPSAPTKSSRPACSCSWRQRPSTSLVSCPELPLWMPLLMALRHLPGCSRQRRQRREWRQPRRQRAVGQEAHRCSGLKTSWMKPRSTQVRLLRFSSAAVHCHVWTCALWYPLRGLHAHARQRAARPVSAPPLPHHAASLCS